MRNTSAVRDSNFGIRYVHDPVTTTERRARERISLDPNRNVTTSNGDNIISRTTYSRHGILPRGAVERGRPGEPFAAAAISNGTATSSYTTSRDARLGRCDGVRKTKTFRGRDIVDFVQNATYAFASAKQKYKIERRGADGRTATQRRSAAGFSTDFHAQGRCKK